MKKLVDPRSSPAPVILSEVRATAGARTESKDPEDLSLDTPRRGILTRFLNARWIFWKATRRVSGHDLSRAERTSVRVNAAKNKSKRALAPEEGRGFSRVQNYRPIIACIALLIIAFVATPLLIHIFADTKPNVQMNVDNVRPRQLEDTTEKAVLRDYTAAWQAIETAFAGNNTAPLNDNFTGFALEKLTQRIKDQHSNDLKTRIIDHGHQVEAIFYSRDGSAIELHDIASIETQVLDGSTVLHSDNAKIQYIAVLTGAADRWQVRVLDQATGNR